MPPNINETTSATHDLEAQSNITQTLESVYSLRGEALEQFMDGQVDYHQMVRDIGFGTTKTMFSYFDELTPAGQPLTLSMNNENFFIPETQRLVMSQMFQV